MTLSYFYDLSEDSFLNRVLIDTFSMLIYCTSQFLKMRLCYKEPQPVSHILCIIKKCNLFDLWIEKDLTLCNIIWNSISLVNRFIWKRLYFVLIVVSWLFSHIQRVSVTIAITLCPLLLSLLLLLLLAWTLLVFRLLFSNCCMDLFHILCGCSLGGPLFSLIKSGCYPYC